MTIRPCNRAAVAHIERPSFSSFLPFLGGSHVMVKGQQRRTTVKCQCGLRLQRRTTSRFTARERRQFSSHFFFFFELFWMSSSDISECMSRCVLRSPQSPFPSYCTFGCEKSKERRERHLIMITFKKDFAKQIFFVSEARNFQFPKTVVQCNKEYNFAVNIQIKHIFAWQAFYYFFS